MAADLAELRAYAHLKNGEVHQALARQFHDLSVAQKGLRDETELRWNQGKQQILFELLQTIETARDEFERIEALAHKKASPRSNAF